MKTLVSLSSEDLSYYLGFLSSLSDIANPEFPGKSWIDENGSECYAEFSEMYMDFDMFCEAILTWPELSKNQRKDLQKFYEMLEDYEDYLPGRRKTDDEIRRDPKWDKIRRFADQLYEDLKNFKIVK